MLVDGSRVLFDPIFEPEDLPAAPLSISEGKLLKKAIGLAMLLAGKTKQMAVDTHHGRRRILLVALAKVASALHEQSLVLRDDRLLDTVEVLAHFPLDQLAGFEWIDIEGLGRRVADSKRLVTLFVWRKKTKREPGVQLSKFMGHLESFAHALGKRQSLLDGLQRFKLAAKRRVFASWHSGATESFAYRRLDLARKRDVLDRWMGERQDQLGEAGRIHASYLLAKCLRKWREQGADRHVDARLRDRLQRFRSRHSRAAQSTGGLFAQWRRLAALSRVAWEKQKDAKYRAFSLWSKRLVNAVWMGRTALFHDKIRRFRPVFAFIKAKSQKYAQAQSYLASHARLKRCYEIFAKWRGAVKTRSIKRRYYDTWLRKAQFLLSASQHARKLFSVTRQLKCFGKWRRKARCRVQLDSSMAARATGLLGRRQRLTFRTWKLKALHLQRNSDLVASWRRLEDKREVFAAWRNRAVVSHNCHTFHLRGVYQLFMGQWRDALAAKRESRTRLWRAFAAWRQHSKALKAVQCFAGSRFARNMVQSGRAVRGNAILNRVSAIRSAAQSADLTATSWFFGHWRHRVSRTGKLLGLLAEHERGRKCKQLQAMRLVLRYHDLENRAPQNDLARAWSSFKLGVARCRQRKLILGLRLDEHFGAREFVLHFRHFKTWERAFQVRKMEEHLCEQNLMAYDHQLRAHVLKQWKMLTAQRMFRQYANLLNRRKAALLLWKQRARASIEERSRRMQGRVLLLWREALSKVRIEPLRAEMALKRTARAWNRWKQLSKSKFDVRFGRQKAVVETPWFAKPPPVPRFDDATVRKFGSAASRSLSMSM